MAGASCGLGSVVRVRVARPRGTDSQLSEQPKQPKPRAMARWGRHGWHTGKFLQRLRANPYYVVPVANLTEGWDGPVALAGGLSSDGTELSARATKKELHGLQPTSGLLLMASTRQGPETFAASAAMFALSAPVLRIEGVLLVCNNASISNPTLLEYLRMYQAPGLRLRLLMRQPLNIGYYCGNLLVLASSVHVWQRFPWVLHASGPDCMATPFGAVLLRHLIDVSDREPIAYLGDRFAGPADLVRNLHHKNRTRWSPSVYPLAIYTRFLMDLFVFWPARFGQGEAGIATAEERGASTSPWSNATRWCVRGIGPDERPMPQLPWFGRPDAPIPEALLNQLRTRWNMTFRRVPMGPGGHSQFSKQRLKEPKHLAYVWHSDNSTAVLEWARQRQHAAANAAAKLGGDEPYQTADERRYLQSLDLQKLGFGSASRSMQPRKRTAKFGG